MGVFHVFKILQMAPNRLKFLTLVKILNTGIFSRCNPSRLPIFPTIDKIMYSILQGNSFEKY